MLTRLFVTLSGLLALIGLWLLVQAWARRALPADARERDVLACALCRGGGMCRCGLRDPGDCDVDPD